MAGFKKLEQSSATVNQDDAMWEAIKKVPHFYDKLELMPGAKEMFNSIYKKYGDKVEILTGKGVIEATIPGKCAAPPAPAIITLIPRS